MTIPEENAAEAFIAALDGSPINDPSRIRADVATAFFQLSLFSGSAHTDWEAATAERRRQIAVIREARTLIMGTLAFSSAGGIPADKVSAGSATAEDVQRAGNDLARVRDRYEAAQGVLDEAAENLERFTAALEERVGTLKPKTNEDPARDFVIRRLFAIYCEAASVHPRSVTISAAKSNRDRFFVEAVQDAFCAFFGAEPGSPEEPSVKVIKKNCF